MDRIGRAEPTPPECARAAEIFDLFCSAGTQKQILALFREMCHTLSLKSSRLPDFYPKLKGKLSCSWKAQALFKKFDARANHKVYSKGHACTDSKVLVIGAGPCGLRAAIECQLLGAKVVVLEKRDRMSRNNVLHLWPFVIHDLRALGAKKFFGKFCAGSIDHISIRQLQCILLKVSLLLGVEFHDGVSFEELLEPTVTENSETLGWRARVSPIDHPVSQYEFDVLLGADGKRNTLNGFKRKEFRGKLAMAITANFINRHSEQEASVPEISGVAFIFNQKFFKDLYEKTGIDLENIVYYKDDTHYFVMTAKKHSLLEKGVLLHDYADVMRLLNVENVDRGALMRYAQEAARFSTDGRLPLRDFALNHYGEPDVALFDFTTMCAAENASLVYERCGRRLLCQLVGDSLLEPFWPTGSGCARGFLSAMDAAWAVRSWGRTPHPHPLEVIAERESIYRLLAQTTPENLHRDFGSYTLEPGTRYPNLNRGKVTPVQVTSFYDSDEPLPLDAPVSARKRRREAEASISDEVLITWVGWSEDGLRAAATPPALAALLRRYRPDLLPPTVAPRAVYSVLHHEFGISPFSSGGTLRDVSDAKIRSYLMRVYMAFKGEVPHVYTHTNVYEQIKQNQLKEKQNRNTTDYSISMYSNATDPEKSHSSTRKKRRSVRPQVSDDQAEYIRRKIGKLDINDITTLTRLLEGNDPSVSDNVDKQKELQEQILALLDPDESPDPQMLRDYITRALQGTTKTIVKARDELEHAKLSKFFQDSSNSAPAKPQKRLKGLDITTVKVLDFSDVYDDSADTDVSVFETPKKKEFLKSYSVDIHIGKDASLGNLKPKDMPKPASNDDVRKKLFIKSASTESSPIITGRSSLIDISKYWENPCLPNTRRASDVGIARRSKSPEDGEAKETYKLPNARLIAQIFENNSGHTPSPEPKTKRSGSTTTVEMAMRMQQMAEIIEGKRRNTLSPERIKQIEPIGLSIALRRQKVEELIEGKPKCSPEKYNPVRRNSEEMAIRIQRITDMIQNSSGETRERPKSRRKIEKEIMRQRFEKSVQMLAAEARLNFVPSADLENDVGLQQYRASAPHFDERVKKLEKQLQHYEEGRIVGGGGRTTGGGVRVAKLAAELAGGNNTTQNAPRATKPRDLMRSVGKIERDDWNVKKIEKKILENRLGRPEPRIAEKVPKWDREQFLGRQRRLKEGDQGEMKWGEIDDTVQKLDQKLYDSGRPDHGTRKVASLATKFVKKDEPDVPQIQPKEECKKRWRGPSAGGVRCAACGARVFAAEGVTADGLHLHRSCFKCAVCKTSLRPGNYTMERNGSRLVCLRHGTSVPDAVAALTRTPLGEHPPPTPERISIELSDGAKEIDEDEWTDRNCLASETSAAGGLSDDEDSSSDSFESADESSGEARASPSPPLALAHRHPPYCTDDSCGYDDFSDDGAESSGNESCSRMREAREARRREVPPDAHPPTDSSEVESEEDTSESSSEDEVSSATEVSTDSEFAREECVPAPSPPAILVTEATPPAPPPPQDYPLSRTRSAGGIATKRALELKRRYLLGEPSPPAVRKSDSTSQLDTKLEAFRSNITEFQKMLNPAPAPAQMQKPLVTFQLTTDDKKTHPMPDIIKNLYSDAPIDLLRKDDISPCPKDWNNEVVKEEVKEQEDLESDSLSEDESSHTETAPNQPVPRVEVHDEGGELIQLDSLMLVNSGTEDNDDKASGTATTTGPTVVAAESESSESCRDITTLALTETELSDWAAESAVLEDCNFDEKDEKKRSKNPRTLSGPKVIHDAKNISAISSHVCGRKSPSEAVMYSNALEHFEFVDEGDQDPSIATPPTPKNEGYMELVDDDYDPYSASNDRSMNFIERSFSETMVVPSGVQENIVAPRSFQRLNDETTLTSVSLSEMALVPSSMSDSIVLTASQPVSQDYSELPRRKDSASSSVFEDELKSPQIIKDIVKENSEKFDSDSVKNNEIVKRDVNENDDGIAIIQTVSLSDISPPLEKDFVESLQGTPSMMELSCTPTEVNMPDTPESIQLNCKIVEPKSVSPLDTSPPLAPETPKSLTSMSNSSITIQFASPVMRLYSPAICRSASENFRSSSRSTDSPSRSMELQHISSGSVSPVSPIPARATDKVLELKREREQQTEVVRRLVLERLGSGGRASRKTARRARISPVSNVPPPVPPPPALSSPPTPPPPPSETALLPPPPPRPAPPLSVTPSFSDPELARERRSKSIMKSISSYLNRRLGPRHKEPQAPPQRLSSAHAQAHKSTGALQEAPPVPPPPASYRPPSEPRPSPAVLPGSEEVDERDAMQLWFEARWARLVAQRRAREQSTEPHARRVARLERKLTRPLSAEQQAATVAELVQVSAQREAHQALIAADRRRSGGVAD